MCLISYASLRRPHGSTAFQLPPPFSTICWMRSMISRCRSSAASGSISSMISYGLILITSSGLCSTGGRRPRRSGSVAGAAPEQEALGCGRQYTGALSRGGPVGRMRWFIVGAAATAGAFIAADRMRRRLAADDELDLEQWDEPAAPVVPSPPRAATAFASYDTVPPADDDTQE